MDLDKGKFVGLVVKIKGILDCSFYFFFSDVEIEVIC